MSDNCFLALNSDDPTLYETICFNATSMATLVGTSEATLQRYSFGAPGTDLDQLWLLVSAGLIFFMQLGFSLLEAGAVKRNSVQNILFKNLMDLCIGGVIFFVFGYGIAYGNEASPDANGFMGVENIVLESQEWNTFFHQWVFAGTAATIVSGCVAERCRTEAYFFYTVAITSWVYPVVAHWAWSGSGWISTGNGDDSKRLYGGVIDFAGSGVVHMVGGFSGIVGAILLGPRYRRFDDKSTSKHKKELDLQFEFGNNVVYQAIGTLILWFGWYGFNCSSTLAANNGAMNLASKVAVTTTLAAASGGITASFGSKLFTYLQDKASGGYWSIPSVCNGILAGLVSITAPCATIHTGSSIIVGIIGACIYFGTSKLLVKMKIDDPLDAFAVHGVCGAWGVLSVALFSTPTTIAYAGFSTLESTSFGERLLTQLIFICAVAAFTVAMSLIVFLTLKLLGVLRISREAEVKGIDVAEFGGKAVNMGITYKRTQSMERAVSDRNVTYHDHDDDDE